MDRAVSCKSGKDWLPRVLEGVRTAGFCVLLDVCPPEFLERTREAMYLAQKGILREVGEERLRQAGEIGMLRLMMKFDPLFYRYLEIPEVLSIVDATVSETAILHLQNGFILPSFPADAQPSIHQNRLHQDFRRVLNGYLASINVLFAIDPFTRDNGCTVVVPGSHQRASEPEPAAPAVPVECPAGSAIVFDSTLWHSAGANRSGRDRLAINHQFTRSFIKQQFDYVRAVGDAAVRACPPRTQQLLGWYTRVVTGLDEYYRPDSERLYRKNQG